MNLHPKENFWEVKTRKSFNELAIKIFNFQYRNNKIYKSYCDLINCNPAQVLSTSEIPYLPISLFKSKKVVSFNKDLLNCFISSSTTSIKPSKHFYHNLNNYNKSFTINFERVYGKISNYIFLALLPSYVENEKSSLIFMVNEIIKKTKRKESGFYLDNYHELAKKIESLDKKGNKIILFGVSFALLEFCKFRKFNLKNTIVMETGGMKGRRKEITREELHKILIHGFGCKKIHSEFGMTELFSQAYSKCDGIFQSPPWMRVSVRDTTDPFTFLTKGKCGGLNIIDLANLDTCSFIATDDLGRAYTDRKFEVLGRFDYSEVRGCNLLIN